MNNRITNPSKRTRKNEIPPPPNELTTPWPQLTKKKKKKKKKRKRSNLSNIRERNERPVKRSRSSGVGYGNQVFRYTKNKERRYSPVNDNSNYEAMRKQKMDRKRRKQNYDRLKILEYVFWSKSTNDSEIREYLETRISSINYGEVLLTPLKHSNCYVLKNTTQIKPNEGKSPLEIIFQSHGYEEIKLAMKILSNYQNESKLLPLISKIRRKLDPEILRKALFTSIVDRQSNPEEKLILQKLGARIKYTMIKGDTSHEIVDLFFQNCRSFISGGIDDRDPNNQNDTLVHRAIRKNNFQLISLLVKKYNVNILIENGDGKTPVELALELEVVGCYGILLKKQSEILKNMN